MANKNFPNAAKALEALIKDEPETTSPALPTHQTFPDAAKALAPFTQPMEATERKPEAAWDGFREALDAATFGKWSSLDPKRKAAQAAWAEEHGGLKTAADIVGRSVPMLAIGAAASVALPEIAAAAGLGAAGEFLAGTGGASLLSRGASLAASGAGLGAAGAGINNLIDAGPKESLLGGAIAGGIAGPIGGVLTAPLRSNIAPAVAQTARDYMRQGVRLTPAQVPGGPVAARGIATLMRLGKGDIPRLTKSLMRSVGADESTPLTQAAMQKLQQVDIPNRFISAANANDKAGMQLAANHAMNAATLERVAQRSGNTGLADPDVLADEIRQATAYPKGYTPGQIGNALGNPVNIQALAEGGQQFARQPPGPLMTMENIKNFGLGVIGAHFAGEELGGLGESLTGMLPHEAVLGAKIAGGLGLASTGIGGAAMNNPLYMKLLLSGYAPSVNPLVSPAQQYLGGQMQPVSAAHAEGDAVPPNELQPQIADAANKYGMDPNLLTRQLHQESGFKNLGPNKAGAMGVAQFTADTAKDYGINPMDPAQSIEGQAHYMSDLSKKYGNSGLALAAYNWGPGKVDKWLASGANPKQVPDETSNYVQSISGVPIENWLTGSRRITIPLNARNVSAGPNISPTSPDEIARLLASQPGAGGQPNVFTGSQ